MSRTRHLRAAAVAVVALSATPAAAMASSVVRSASGANRSGLIRALVRQDGTRSGVTGVYIARSNSRLGVVCQRTPDAGKVGYVFKRSRRGWSYVTSSRVATSSTAYRQLVHVC